MIKLENKKITNVDERVTSSDHIISLHTDIDATFLGVITFSDASTKVLSFDKSKEEHVYKARLVIDKDTCRVLGKVTIYLILINGPLSEKTSAVEIKFDKESIIKDLRKASSDEIIELKTELKQLEDIVNSLTYGKVISQLNLGAHPVIKKGMIPVAIDDHGNFVAMYPFAANVTEVNNQKAVNGVITLDATMIKYKGDKSIELALDNISEALTTMHDLLKTLSKKFVRLSKRVDDIDLQLQHHINNTIV